MFSNLGYKNLKTNFAAYFSNQFNEKTLYLILFLS